MTKERTDVIPGSILKTFKRMLHDCVEPQMHFAPTILLNEGWMIRFLVQASKTAKINLHGLDFDEIKDWYSEGMLKPPFLPRAKKDPLAEGYTHADVILGDISFDTRADAKGSVLPSIPEKGLGHFCIIEAKMKSCLSKGTTHAPGYDQASRNLACLAYNTLNRRHVLHLIVAAPKITLQKCRIEKMVDHGRMLDKIDKRFEQYRMKMEDSDISQKLRDAYAEVYALKEDVIARAATASCLVVSYEKWLDELTNRGSPVSEELKAFYRLCLVHNRVQ